MNRTAPRSRCQQGGLAILLAPGPNCGRIVRLAAWIEEHEFWALHSTGTPFVQEPDENTRFFDICAFTRESNLAPLPTEAIAAEFHAEKKAVR